MEDLILKCKNKFLTGIIFNTTILKITPFEIIKGYPYLAQ